MRSTLGSPDAQRRPRRKPTAPSAPPKHAVPLARAALNPLLVPLLDLLGEVIAAEVWSQAHEASEAPAGRAPDPPPTPRAQGAPTPMPDEPGNSGPIPTVPVNSHSHSRPSPAKARAAQPTNAKENP